MIATRFSVGLHILVIVASDPPGGATSLRLAASIGTNPVVVRRIAGQLSRAGLITVQRGPGGATLTRPPEAISLKDVWRAIHPAPEVMLRVHRQSPQACPLGQRIPPLLRRRFDQAEAAMLTDLNHTTLADLVQSARQETAEAAD
jgi:DNA-binding IscR family transcriptional regulator